METSRSSFEVNGKRIGFEDIYMEEVKELAKMASQINDYLKHNGKITIN